MRTVSVKAGQSGLNGTRTNARTNEGTNAPSRDLLKCIYRCEANHISEYDSPPSAAVKTVAAIV